MCKSIVFKKEREYTKADEESGETSSAFVLVCLKRLLVPFSPKQEFAMLLFSRDAKEVFEIVDLEQKNIETTIADFFLM